MWADYKALRYVSGIWTVFKTFLMPTFQPVKTTPSPPFVVFVFRRGIRGRSRPRASCSSRIPSPSPSRTVASCPEPKRDGSSFLSRWSSSASQSTGRKVSPSQDTSLRTASRFVTQLKKRILLPGYELHNRSPLILAQISTRYIIPRQGFFRGLHVLVEVFNKQLSRPDSSQMLIRCDMFQVSCLGVEPSVDGDDAPFVLTSRNPDGSVVRFQLQAASPDVCRAWVNDVVQILESQRNFLNGKSQLSSGDDTASPLIHKSCSILFSSYCQSTSIVSC